jgi:hypothetical protein
MSTRVLEREPHADADGIAVTFHFCGKGVKKCRPTCSLLSLLCEKQQQQQQQLLLLLLLLQTHV